MKINIVDYIGNKTGMHYYNEAFSEIIHEIEPKADVAVLSIYNPEASEAPFLKNQFEGNVVTKVTRLCLNYAKLYRYISSHPDETYIYLTYGNVFDIPFLKIISRAPHHIIDIHEVIAQNIDSKQGVRNMLRNLYVKNIKAVISHSGRTEEFLDEFGYQGVRLHVPHFRYRVKTDYDVSSLPAEVRDAVLKHKLNILYFGNITYDKGIDAFIDAVNKLDSDTKSKINVIVAGRDFDGAINNVRPADPELFKFILRRIDDNELIYLYANSQFVALPYRKTSQSGVLEMAFHFKKPIIASDISYFRETLAAFPSFGVLAANDYTKALAQAVNAPYTEYFTGVDYDNYTNRKQIMDFKVEFADWLSCK